MLPWYGVMYHTNNMWCFSGSPPNIGCTCQVHQLCLWCGWVHAPDAKSSHACPHPPGLHSCSQPQVPSKDSIKIRNQHFQIRCEVWFWTASAAWRKSAPWPHWSLIWVLAWRLACFITYSAGCQYSCTWGLLMLGCLLYVPFFFLFLFFFFFLTSKPCHCRSEVSEHAMCV